MKIVVYHNITDILMENICTKLGDLSQSMKNRKTYTSSETFRVKDTHLLYGFHKSFEIDRNEFQKVWEVIHDSIISNADETNIKNGIIDNVCLDYTDCLLPIKTLIAISKDKVYSIEVEYLR